MPPLSPTAAEISIDGTRFFLAVLALASVLCACDRPIPPLRPDASAPAPTGSTCPSTSTLSYESFGRAFFERYCQSCHASDVVGADRQGAPSSHTYDTVTMIRADADEIDRRAAAGPDAVNDDMPRTPPLPSLRERLSLGEWIACGAP